MLLDIAAIGVNALSWAMATFLVASGLTLIFGVLHILNFSHGGFFLLGAYLTFTAAQALGGELALVPYVLVSIGAGIAVACIGAAVDLLVFRRLRAVDDAYILIATYALLLLAEGLMKMVWGVNSVLVIPPAELLGAFVHGPVVIPYYSLFIIAWGILIFVALEWFMLRTMLGKLVQAVAIDPWMSTLMAVDVQRIYTITIVIGFALAGLAGGLLAANQGLSPQLGGTSIIQAFCAIIVGGMGSIRGAFYASILLGAIDAVGTSVFPIFPDIFIYLALAAMLLIRPSGLISRGFAA